MVNVNKNAENLLIERRKDFEKSRARTEQATHEFIIFERAGERFGFYAHNCDQIRRLPLSIMENVEPVIAVCIVSGKVYAVVDYCGDNTVEDRGIVALVTHTDYVVGIIVDEVVGLVSCNDDEWRSTDSVGEYEGTLADGTPILNISHLWAQWNMKGNT